MSATPANPAPAARRDLKSPYFVFRTPDGTGSYFTGENLPIVMSPHEPLARYLAPARIVESGTLRSIVYDFEGLPLETMRRMEFIPQSEIDGFAEAVRAFYDKAHAATPRIVPHEKRLRAHFRLPDPEMEPDAYWVYGPAHDRRLMILWGCEFKSGSSLLLAPDEELKIALGRTVLDRLQARVMNWEGRQREALKLALDPVEPISRFLGRAAVDEAGQTVGVRCQEETIPLKSLKPLKRILAPECGAFEKAAKAYYDKAFAATGVTAYEKEIRRAFRLPNIDQGAHSHLLRGGRLIIVVDGKETEALTLPLIDHPALAPAARARPAADGPVVIAAGAGGAGGATVAAKLRQRVISTGVMLGIAAAAVIVLGAGGYFAYEQLRPKTLKVIEVTARSDHEVAVKFSNPIKAESLAGKEPAFLFVGDLKPEMAAPTLDEKDRSVVLLRTGELLDNKKYILTISGVEDRRGGKLKEAEPVEFTYLDNVPPALVGASAGEEDNQLVLVFSKRIAENSVSRGDNYLIVESGSAGTPQKITSGRPDPEDKTGRRVILESNKKFTRDLPYRLDTLTGVTDTSSSRNPVILAKGGFPFPYKDLLPPRIKADGVSANAGKLELTVEFNEPMDPKVAEDAGNYTAVAPDKTELGFVKGAARLDTAGKRLTLRLAPARLTAGRHILKVTGAQDLAQNKITQPIEAPFEFADAAGSKPFAMDKFSAEAGSSQILVTFNRALNPEDASATAKFRLLDGKGRASTLSVTEARRVPEDPSQVRLILSGEFTQGQDVVVSASGISDIFGNKAPGEIKSEKVIVGGASPLTEQIIKWVGRPTIKGNIVTLVINEIITKATAANGRNYEFSSDAAQIEKVRDVITKEDGKTGKKTTTITLILRAPLASPAGVRLSVRNLLVDQWENFGPQTLDPLELEFAP